MKPKLQVYIDKSLIDKLKQTKMQYGMSESFIVEKALKQYFGVE
jgi:hypothetical protein